MRDGKIFVTSDWHLNHNRCATQWRGFNGVEEMNEDIFSNFNLTLDENDICYHIGDFWFRKIENLSFKHLRFVKGNHDKNSLTNVENVILNIDGYKIELVHRPEDATKTTSFVIHGHIHKTGKRVVDKKAKYINDYIHILNGIVYFDVNVEFHKYKPLDIKNVLGLMKKVKKEDKNEKKI